ncbi:nonribosomal peptide synthetase MxaA [Methylobacterium planeticum]|uniref:Nonribosomal peptide synthetase MxaA n=1 Tax=Methylobacterium planeticum TaxID=2615211 RepID=A0A6N6MYN9_9HYPH|nr:nonribosomal peptide synthetase MxaA [Methylobacterium planeticum]KAB1074462.1 nonribosomal peptide synthetase MxaA [Methylobacterium planeticum]
MRPLLALLSLLLAACPGMLAAQVRSVEVRTPRPFGYFLGDLVQAQVDIVADSGFSVQAASLPKPGPVAYWLDLRDVGVAQVDLADARRIRLSLTYQNFYAALDARALEIPGFAVTLANESHGGTTTAIAQVPAWMLNVSPLREVQPPARENPVDYVRSDGRVAALDVAPALRAAGTLLGLAALALILLGWHRAWWPFGARPGRAFAIALRRLAGLSRRPDADAAYREALLSLHRGFDETDGRRVLADDLLGFLDRHPAFRPLNAPLTRFFAASRLAFFGGATAAARGDWSLAEVEETARRLAAAERTR